MLIAIRLETADAAVKANDTSTQPMPVNDIMPENAVHQPPTDDDDE